MFDLWKQICHQVLKTRSPRKRRANLPSVSELLEVRQLLSTFYVSPTGNDSNTGLALNSPFKTIQHGIDEASHAGDTIMVRGGTYHEHLIFTHSGNATGGYITLEPYKSEKPTLNGTGVASSDIGYGNNMVQLLDISYVKLIGFEIAYDNGISDQVDAFGVRVQGYGTNVQILNNLVHDITGSVALGVGGAGIHVYGSSLTSPYAGVIISGNQIYNCQPGDSQTETLTVNGNVTNFQITNNVIHDDNNIGIDMIGGESAVFGLPAGTQNLPVARNGVCSHNTVYHIHANYGGGYAGGIYVDGGKNIVISDNISDQNDLGLEVGAENHGYISSGITVKNNILYNNTQGGLLFGGYDSTTGRVQNCSFINNTIYNNDTSYTGQGQIMISYASNNLVANNIIVASANNVLINLPCANSGTGNTIDNNLYFATGGLAKAKFNWIVKGVPITLTFSQFKTASGDDAHSIFANPLFANASAGNFRETAKSPSIRKGSSKSGWYATTDFAGVTRILPPDIGAYEFHA